MSRQDAFDRILASLHEAMLDDSRWPATSALIDDACGMSGSALIVGEGDGDDVRIWFARTYAHGQRRQDFEHQYFDNYYPHDERLPRIRKLPDSQLVHVPDLYTEQELKTSLVYNEGLRRMGSQNGLNVRLDGPRGSRIVWAICDPLATDGWGSPQIEMIERLLPHIRQFIYVRQALANAEVLGASLTELLDVTRVGAIHLDSRGRVVEANDLARDILRRGYGLSDRGGFLGAWLPADNSRLGSLLAAALSPSSGGPTISGSMTVASPHGRPRLVLHVTPLRTPRLDFGAGRVAALVLVVDPTARPRIDAGLAAAALDLTAAESQVAARLGEGRSVRDIASDTGCQANTIYIHLKQIYRKLGISRQADLVRLVLGLAGLPRPRR